jgi:hypothetical protein
MSDSKTSEQTLNRIEVPKIITLGGHQYSVADNPALKDLVDKARADSAVVEKTKLYPSIVSLQNQLTTLEKVTVVPEITNAGNVPVNSDEILHGIKEAITSALAPLITSNNEITQKNASKYRAQIIEENAGKIIPDFIVGNTVEEIDASLIKALETFNTYKGHFGVSTVEEQVHTPPAAPIVVSTAGQANNGSSPLNGLPIAPTPIETITPQTLPIAPVNTAVVESVIPDIGSMSMEEFRNSREDLKKQIDGLITN